LKKRIAVLGSTGTLGVHALQIIEENPELFEAAVLTAHTNADLAIAQARKFQPKLVCFTGLAYDRRIEQSLPPGTKADFGTESLITACSGALSDLAFIAVVGIAGLPALMECVKNGLAIALANKEALVCGGHIVRPMLEAQKRAVLPVDSELSAIFQCMGGKFDIRDVRRIILTASGGPFRDSTASEIYNATPELALMHPTWRMGRKITVDSATMVNKALEVIETRWLYDMDPDRIEVVIHPQSIVHSMVEYKNGAVLAQLSPTDMRQPIQYAFSWPERLNSAVGYLDFSDFKDLQFETPDYNRFPALKLGYDCLKQGGGATVVLNGANEAAVAMFLDNRIPMGRIVDLICDALDKFSDRKCDTIEEVYELDEQVKKYIQTADGV
jgi:1-deoxy-D-xylulose-5-phosphate reductoisomerase